MVDEDAIPALSLDQFERLEFDAAQFDHAAHVRVAWLYLASVSLSDTITRYCATLRRLTRREGVPEKYHETITWFLLTLIAERRAECPAATWKDFRTANADLFDDLRGLLSRHYSRDRLDSDAARRRFLLPDRSPVERAA